MRFLCGFFRGSFWLRGWGFRLEFMSSLVVGFDCCGGFGNIDFR